MNLLRNFSTITIIFFFALVSESCNDTEQITPVHTEHSEELSITPIAEVFQTSIPSNTPTNPIPTTTPTTLPIQTKQESYLLVNMDDGIYIINPYEPEEIHSLSYWIDEGFKNADLHGFSPDGYHLLISRMQSWNPSKRRIYVLDLRNFSIHQLLQESAAQTFAQWHPNGEQIVLSLFFEDQSKNYIVYLNGSSLKELPSVGQWDMMPKWSPDGELIYFLSTNEYELFSFPPSDIYVMDSSGANIRKLTNEPYIFQSFSLSPDGSRIAFTAPTMGEDIYILNTDGSKLVNITNSPSRETSLYWSPDSSKIAFQTDRDGNWELYIIDADGSNLERLTNHPELDGPYLWSPNGDYLSFISTRSGEYQIYIIMMDDYSIHKITNASNYPFLADIWVNKTNTSLSLLDLINMFEIGRSLKISEAGNNLNLRSLPELDSEIAHLESGDHVNILEGPHTAYGYTWWKISNIEQGIIGWVAENPDWFEPLIQ